ncbi:MAG: hypothetical protein ACK5HR_03205, partial [Mycoplasmatales bacterium]
MKILKYSINEIYQNKFNMLLLLIMTFIVIINVYILLCLISDNYNNSKVPNEIKNHDIISMVNLRPMNYSETSSEVYNKFFTDVLTSNYKDNLFQFKKTEFTSTLDKSISTGEENPFNLDDNLNLQSIDGLIASKNFLENQDINIKFLDEENWENFNNNKVLIPIKYASNYQLGDSIEFYTPYYNETDENIVQMKKYKVVGYIEEDSKVLSPQSLNQEKVDETIIFPAVNMEEYSYNNIEYDGISQELIMSAYFYIKEDNLSKLTDEITSIGKNSKMSINLTDNAAATKITAKSEKLTLINNLKLSIPIIILFIIGLSYIISNILKRRIKYLSILSSIGAKERFIKLMYL